jgi:hypothetical protein
MYQVHTGATPSKEVQRLFAKLPGARSGACRKNQEMPWLIDIPHVYGALAGWTGRANLAAHDQF